MLDRVESHGSLTTDEKLTFLQTLYTVLNDDDFAKDKADYQLAERKVFEEIAAPYFDEVDQHGVADEAFDFIAIKDRGLVDDMFRDVTTSDKLDLEKLSSYINDRPVAGVATEPANESLRFGRAVAITEASLYRCVLRFQLSTDGAGLQRFYPVDKILNDFDDSVEFVVPLKCATLFEEQAKRVLPGRYSAARWTPDGRAIECKVSADIEDACRFIRDNLLNHDVDGNALPYRISAEHAGQWLDIYADHWTVDYDFKRYQPHEFLVFMKPHL